MAPKKPEDNTKSFLSLIEKSLTNFSDAPIRYRVIVEICLIFFALTLVLGAATLAFQDVRRYSLYFFLGSVVVALFSLIVLLKIARLPDREGGAVAPSMNPGGNSPVSGNAGPVYEERKIATLEQPISNTVILKLVEQLKSLRKEIYTAFAKDRNVGLDDIRANIFLPTIEITDEGVICELAIHPRLKLNMAPNGDCKIKFRPGQGFVGKAFNLSEPASGHIVPMNSSHQETDENFLTRQQEKLLDSRLRWVICVPLTVAVGGNGDFTVGVICIDGLRNAITDEALKDVLAVMLSFVGNYVIDTIKPLPKSIFIYKLGKVSA
jgi:hypothetical protein